MTEVAAGRVGKAHGRDGSFYVDDAQHPLPPNARIRLAGEERSVERRSGTDDRPLIRVSGVEDREAAVALHGEPLLVDASELPLEENEYLVSELIGCEVPGIGRIERVLDGPSCDVLEVGPDAVLVPLVGDAVKRVDLDAGVVEVDRDFLDL